MSVTTIYKCDKCGSEQYDDQQFWVVGVTATDYSKTYTVPNTAFVYQKSINVCRKCLDEMGVLVREKNISEPDRTTTVEDLIKQILEICQE